MREIFKALADQSRDKLVNFIEMAMDYDEVMADVDMEVTVNYETRVIWFEKKSLDLFENVKADLERFVEIFQRNGIHCYNDYFDVDKYLHSGWYLSVRFDDVLEKWEMDDTPLSEERAEKIRDIVSFEYDKAFREARSMTKAEYKAYLKHRYMTSNHPITEYIREMNQIKMEEGTRRYRYDPFLITQKNRYINVQPTSHTLQCCKAGIIFAFFQGTDAVSTQRRLTSGR